MEKNGNNISFKSIIESIYSDTNIKEIPWQDALEWVYKALRTIGGDSVFEPVFVDTLSATADSEDLLPIEVENYRAKLPTNFIRLLGDPYKLVMDGDSLNVKGIISMFHKTNFDDVYPDGDFSTKDIYNYRLRHSYIETNFRSGYIQLNYLSVPMDENNYPLIPDDNKIIEAVQWYVIEKLDYIKWRSGKLSDKVYQDTVIRKGIAIKRAKSHVQIPSLGEMNEWVFEKTGYINPKYMRLMNKFRQEDVFLYNTGLPMKLPGII